MPLPASLEEEVEIVKVRVEKIGQSLELPADAAPVKEIKRLVTIFRELRSGKTTDGRTKLKSPSSTLSTAEAISVVNQGQALAAHFGDGNMKASDLAAGPPTFTSAEPVVLRPDVSAWTGIPSSAAIVFINS